MFPAEYEFDLVLRNGEVGRFRPIKPADAAELVDLFDRIGEQSRYYRFFRVKDRLTDEEVAYFTNVDYDRRMAFVAHLDEQMVGVGRYDVGDDGTAEVAFTVADDHQGKGIGTQLLQVLTAYARAHGVERFSAWVLPDNVQMMRLFRNSGYELRRTLDEGVFLVEFPVAHSDDVVAATMRREQQAISASLLPMFYPRSVAVIGASTDEQSIGGRLFRNVIDSEFAGSVYPVHPTAPAVAGVTAYRSVVDIPEPVDLAFVVVPAPIVPHVARECADKQVRGIVVISAGFSETGAAGRQREAELLDIVREGGMRLVGPNCMGLLNTDPAVSLNGTFGPTFPLAGNIAMSSQSGALGIAILDYTRRHNIGISSFVSVGNKADVSGNDLLLLWENDPATDVIVLYLESFGNPRRFARIARRIGRKKPIVAVKAGRTAAGTRAASSHTGALASADIAVEALFDQAGVIRTTTLQELFDVAALLSSQPLPTGERVAVITNAGGPGILAADAIESAGLVLPEFSDGLQDRLRTGLPPEAAVANPIDLIASAGPEEYAHALSVVASSDEVDAIIGIYIPASAGADVGRLEQAVMDVAEADASDKTWLAVIMHPDPGQARLSRAGLTIPVYEFPEEAARALARAVEYAHWRRRPLGGLPTFGDFDQQAIRDVVGATLDGLPDEGGWMPAEAVWSLLTAAGIRVPETAVVTSPEDAVAAADRIGTPVAVKVDSNEALHKSDIGGLRLGVSGADDVLAAFAAVTSAVSTWDSVVVQEMVGGHHEVLIGVADDPDFGQLIAFGLGGVFVELLGDVAFRINPIDDIEVDEMIAEVKAATLLRGYRDIPAGDVAAARDLLLRVSALVEATPEIVEMDCNPVRVLDPGDGAVVVDARIRLRPVAPGWSPELEDFPSRAGSGARTS